MQTTMKISMQSVLHTVLVCSVVGSSEYSQYFKFTS